MDAIRNGSNRDFPVMASGQRDGKGLKGEMGAAMSGIGVFFSEACCPLDRRSAAAYIRRTFLLAAMNG